MNKACSELGSDPILTWDNKSFNDERMKREEEKKGRNQGERERESGCERQMKEDL